MRIRKHAKKSPLVYEASSMKPGTIVQAHICQLNQSPWDVMNFSPPSSPPPPPPPSQVNGSDGSAGNGSFAFSISALEREMNMWLQSEYPNSIPKAEPRRPPPPPVKDEPEIVFCCKTDGKSWQCRREASKGNSLCEHHLSLVKSYTNNSPHPAKKSVKPATPAGEAPPPRRQRPKKPQSASSSSNPYEFYYYSGFGPRWGKKRGETSKNNGGSMPKNLEEEREKDIEAKMESQIGEEEFDFAEYEDDDEEDEIRDNGKKRVRKPIKARSLKSLM